MSEVAGGLSIEAIRAFVSTKPSWMSDEVYADYRRRLDVLEGQQLGDEQALVKALAAFLDANHEADDRRRERDRERRRREREEDAEHEP